MCNYRNIFEFASAFSIIYFNEFCYDFLIYTFFLSSVDALFLENFVPSQILVVIFLKF